MNVNTQQKILLVEDDISLSRMIAHALRDQGYLVETASTGLQGLKAVRE